MKKTILLLLVLSFSTITYSQTLKQITKENIQPKLSTTEVKEGIRKAKELCKTKPQEKCNKVIASGYYLIADDYYKVAYEVYLVDSIMAKPIFKKADSLFKKAKSYMPITEYSEIQKNLLIGNKRSIESSPTFKLKW